MTGLPAEIAQELAVKTNRQHRRQGDRPLICIDGEGITVNDRHYYNLLAAANDTTYQTYIHAENLTTDACFDFLLDQPRNALLFGFALGYDVTKWCQDMPLDRLVRLFKVGSCHYRGKRRLYRVHYLQNRRFGISLPTDKTKTSYRAIYDVFGFFQTSFVKTLEQWSIGTPDERKALQSMKDQRSIFTASDFRAILEYCYSECAMGVRLMRTLMAACSEAAIVPRQWWGAGAIAAAACDILHIKEFMADCPIFAGKPLACAYAGGRTDIAASGRFENVHSYDINSAYPHAIRSLPCLKHISVLAVSEYDPDALAIWHVRWEGITGPWPPFYVRDAKGTMHYPTGGEGWYWSAEVSEAMRHFGANITVLGGIVFSVECTELPFAKVAEWYEIRKEWKKSKPGAAQILKLALNAIYGKTAQTIGWEDQPPPYHSLIWAGIITATCRAMVYRAVMTAPLNILSWSTDGILSEVELDLPCSDALGEWSHAMADIVWIYQPGVYAVKRGGKWSRKNRGFGTREIEWWRLTRAMQSGRWSYKYQTTRFIPIGGAIARSDYRCYLGQWIRTDRIINLAHSRRTPASLVKGNKCQTWWRPEGAMTAPSVPYLKSTYSDRQTKIASIRPR